MKSVLLTISTVSALFCAETLPSPELKPSETPKIIRSAMPRYMPEEPKTSRALFSGNFLFWIPEMEGLTYANETIASTRRDFNPKTEQVETVPTLLSRPLEVKGNWEPGFRLSMGYLFDEKGLDTVLNWTYFKNEPSHKAPEGAKISPQTLPPGTFFATSVDTARGKWYLLQNTLDLEVGYNFPVGATFVARPFGGLSGTTLRSKTVFHYAIDSEAFSASAKVPTKSNFSGLGPRIGGNLAYEFGKGIGIFALGSGAVLIGKFESAFHGQDDSPGSLRTVTSMQILMGIEWQRVIRDHYFFGIKAAWEQNFYSGVNRAVRHLDNIFQENGDLILKGLTASCHLDF